MSVLDLAATEVRDGVPRAAGELVHLRLRGPLTVSTAPRLRDLICAYTAAADRRLLVDLEGVTAVDASGIAALLDGQRAVAATPAGGMFLRLNPTVTRALKRSGTLPAFRVWRSPTPADPPALELG